MKKYKANIHSSCTVHSFGTYQHNSPWMFLKTLLQPVCKRKTTSDFQSWNAHRRPAFMIYIHANKSTNKNSNTQK